MTDAKLDILQGTLDLMVLQTLAAMGPLHGYGVARRIEQVSGNAVALNQGTIYASLVRLQQRGWISAAWGTSDNNRRAKFYALTRAGRRALAAETSSWERLSAVMGRILVASSLRPLSSSSGSPGVNPGSPAEVRPPLRKTRLAPGEAQ
jgi:transcriptional regulator